MPRFCLFCSEETKKRSKEHIVPQWLWPYVGLKKKSVIRSVHKGRIGSSRSQSVVLKNLPERVANGFVEGRVCTECNTGWMSRLENKVKPILFPILDMATLVDEWPSETRELLARWAVKTSLMAISTSVVLENAPIAHFQAIKRGIIAPGISVFVGYHMMLDKGFSYEAGRHWDVEIPTENTYKSTIEISELMHQYSYKVCLQFRSLLLMSAYTPMPELVLSLDDRTHQLIWTDRRTTQRRNPPMFTDMRRPFGMLLTSDKARRRFADLMRVSWAPISC